jgi:hypothetical protein
VNGQTYRTNSVPIDRGGENSGVLTVGEPLDIASLAAPAVLVHQGRIVEANTPGLKIAAAESALHNCPTSVECEIRIGDSVFTSSSMEKTSLADGYELRTLQNLDGAAGPIQAALRSVFMLSGVVALVALRSSTVRIFNNRPALTKFWS